MLRESTKWYLFLLAGLVLLITLGIHYGVMHLGGLFGAPRSETLTFASVSARSGRIFYMTVYLILLAAALYHGLYGLRAVVYEISALPWGVRQAAGKAIAAAGFVFFIYGSWAIITGFLAQRGM